MIEMTQLNTAQFGFNFPLNNTSYPIPGSFYETPENAAKKLLRLIAAYPDGRIAINQAIINALTIGGGDDIFINGLNLSLLAAKFSHVKPRTMQYQAVEIKTETGEEELSNGVVMHYTTISSLVGEFTDERNVYGLIHETKTYENGRKVNNEMMVVLGFYLGPKHRTLMIPSYVIVKNDLNDNLDIYPINKIVSTRFFGQVNIHTNRNNRYFEEITIPVHEPYALFANSITEIDLTYNICSTNYGIFYKFPIHQVYMENLETIKANKDAAVPVFSGIDKLRKLVVPKLKTIENVIFASQNPMLSTVDFSSLETIDESVFLAECPMIKELSLPSLRLLRGDYFCYKNYGLKDIHFPVWFGIRPHHVILNESADDMQTFRGFILKIQYEYRRSPSTTALQYFCGQCIGLMNARVTKEEKEETEYNAPYDLGNVNVSLNGFHFNLQNGAIGSWSVVEGDKYGSCICSLKQYCEEEGIAVPSTDNIDVIEPAEGSEFKYCTEKTYGIMLDGTDKSTVMSIDFRTALLNVVSQPQASSTMLHIYTETSIYRFVPNPSSYNYLIKNESALPDVMAQFCGDNQFYNFGYTGE